MKALAEIIIGWASIAYAAGFVIILLQMWDLGLPVPESLDAVYIWIGAPVAIILFLAAWNWRRLRLKVKTRIEMLQNEVKGAENEAANVNENANMLDWFLLLASRLAPFPPVLGESYLKRLAQLEGWLRLKSQKEGLPAIPAALRSVTSKGLHFYLVYSAYDRFLSFISYFVLVFALVCLYAGLYSAIPQSLGGGKPVPVNLIVDTEKVSLDAPELRALFAGDSEPSHAKFRTTKRVELLYSTKEAYFIRNSTNAIVTLNSDSVSGIIW